MNQERFRVVMEEQWSSIEGEPKRSRDPNLAAPELLKWYRTLSIDDKRLADQILAEWVHHPDKTRQFESLVLISEFNISSALPSLGRLADNLIGATDPDPRFLRLKVLRLIDQLRLQSRNE